MVLNTVEATEFLGCKKTTMYRMLKRGSLDGTYYTVGSKRLFIKSKLEEWQENGGESQFAKSRMINTKQIGNID